MSHGCLIAARAALVAFALFSPVSESHAALPEEAWQGIVTHENATEKVRVRMTMARERLVLKFGEPANCSIVAERFDHSNLGEEYRFRPVANGGAFCNRLYPGTATLRAGGEDGRVLSFPRQGRDWRGLLTPVEP